MTQVHDLNMLISTTVAAKAVILGAGAGYMSNTWWPATFDYQPTAAGQAQAQAHVSGSRRRPLDLRKEGEAAMRLIGSSPQPPPSAAAAAAAAGVGVPPGCETPTLTKIGEPV